MRTQEEYIALGPHNKTILWPLVSEWGELFAAYSLDEKGKPSAHTFRTGPGKYDVCTIGPYMMTRFNDGTQTVIRGFASPNYRYGPTVYARLHDDRAKAAFESTIGLDDGLFFELIQWDDKEAVILMSHNKIIGSRWLAVIDPSTIPADVREE